MDEADWEKLNELLTQVINLKLPTWREKLEEFKSNIDEDVWNEIESWFASAQSEE
jgi:hypothetical protein